MPTTWVITLNGPHQRPETHHLHALASRWMDIDHHANQKAWSLGRSEETESGFELEISSLIDTDVERLLPLRGTEVRLGKCTYEVSETVKVTACVGWRSMYELAQPTPQISFAFDTPLLFRSSQGDAVLSAGLLFGHLRKRWCSFVRDPELMPEVSFDDCGLSLLSLVGQHVTVDVPLGKTQRPMRLRGFEGLITVDTSRASDRDSQVLSALALLAPYSGIGSYTTRGYGHVSATATSSRAPLERQRIPLPFEERSIPSTTAREFKAFVGGNLASA
jgi:hypothetical protein